jgi:hypothetical protein
MRRRVVVVVVVVVAVVGVVENWLVSQLAESCYDWCTWTVWEPRGNGMSVAGIRYRKTGRDHGLRN